MPRDSIFDPEGTQTDRRGDRYMGPDADYKSHMPPSVTDGKVDEEEAADLERLANFKCGDGNNPDADTLDQVAQANCDRDKKPT